MDIIESLNQEVMLVENPTYRAALKAILQSPSMVDPDFLIMPASLGYHHPLDERGEGGLLLHTRRVLKIANIILEGCPDDTDYQVDKDAVRMACILHDAARPVSRLDHPSVMAKAILLMTWYDPDNIPKIANMVKRHMGKWGVELPQSREDWLVHIADNLAAKYY